MPSHQSNYGTSSVISPVVAAFIPLTRFRNANIPPISFSYFLIISLFVYFVFQKRIISPSLCIYCIYCILCITHSLFPSCNNYSNNNNNHIIIIVIVIVIVIIIVHLLILISNTLSSTLTTLQFIIHSKICVSTLSFSLLSRLPLLRSSRQALSVML